MRDEAMMVVNANHPEIFSKEVNKFLGHGNWRVAETEMSVSDSHYWAILIRSEDNRKMQEHFDKIYWASELRKKHSTGEIKSLDLYNYLSIVTGIPRIGVKRRLLGILYGQNTFDLSLKDLENFLLTTSQINKEFK